jgi:hypothetical protein
MTAAVVRFPPRHLRAVWVLPLAESGWLVLLGATGWLYGNYRNAIEDAQWLARNLGFPIQEAAA